MRRFHSILRRRFRWALQSCWVYYGGLEFADLHIVVVFYCSGQFLPMLFRPKDWFLYTGPLIGVKILISDCYCRLGNQLTKLCPRFPLFHEHGIVSLQTTASLLKPLKNFTNCAVYRCPEMFSLCQAASSPSTGVPDHSTCNQSRRCRCGVIYM